MRKYIPIILLSAISILCIAKVSTANTNGVEKFIQGLADSVIETIASEDLSKDKKQDELNRLFTKSVDTKWMGKFAMGKHWRHMSKDQKKQYLPLYHDYLLNTYVPKFEEYKNQQFQLKKATPSDEKNEYRVDTTIIDEAQGSISVDYRVRYASGRYKIFDIIAEGVSLVSTHRSEFNTVVSRQGVDYLIEQLKKKQSK